ncbi:MAG TPA: PA14 domain-containing protein, partial [Polyangia bacterium]|nr:PA14 domain-containing protein [Polyangia bacterium]
MIATTSLMACQEVADLNQSNHESTALSAENGLPQINGLNVYNGLNSYNGLNVYNGLNTYNGLNSYNGISNLSLMGSDSGRKTVSYLVRCALPAGHQITKQDQYGNWYTFPGAIGVGPGWENGTCDQSCQEAVSACVMAHVNTAAMHIPIWLDSPAAAIGWGRNSSYPNQEGTFFGNIFLPSSSGTINAFYCNGPGFATSVVPGRLGVYQQGAPYRNPFGDNAQCASNCVAADSPNTGDGYKSCMGYSNPVTVWRQPAATFSPSATYKICKPGDGQCLDGATGGLSSEWYRDPNLGYMVGLFADDTVNFTDMAATGTARVGRYNDFSVRFSGQVFADASQTYTFYTMSDDGVRLWVNGALLVDNWTYHGPTENAGAIYLAGGQWYDIKMEYMQGGSGGIAQLSWSAPTIGKAIVPSQKLRPAAAANPAGLTTEWFGDRTLSALKTSFVDSTVDMPDVTQYSLGRLGTANDFSVRFSGQVLADYSQTYTFYTRSDDGVRLWVNNTLLIDNWTGHSATDNQASINLSSGQWYDIKMEYMQMSAGATIQLSWSAPSVPRAIIPAYKLRPYASNGLSGQWYGDTNLGALRGTFVDPTVDFADTTGVGAARAGSGSAFTVRWTGQVLADTNDS